MRDHQVSVTLIIRFIILSLGAWGLITVLNSCGGPAEEANSKTEETSSPEAAPMEAVAEGREWYLSYCTMCHGEDARGKGVLSDSLSMTPPDLTLIAARRSGNFPQGEIANIIADASEVPGHGTGDMPAWWETFQSSEGITDAAVLQEKIDHIVAYLETIQRSE